MTQYAQGTLPDIQHTYVLNAPVQKVWRAIATSEGLAAWLMPNDFQAVLGHAFTFQTQPDGDFDGIIHSKVLELDPPHRLVFTWDANNMYQFISFELKELDNRTEFSIVHSGWLAGQEKTRNLLDGGWGSVEHNQKAIEKFIGV